jgi:hypothetical protein
MSNHIADYQMVPSACAEGGHVLQCPTPHALLCTCQQCCAATAATAVDQAADGAMDVDEDDDGADFLLKDNGDDLDLRLARLEVGQHA